MARLGIENDTGACRVGALSVTSRLLPLAATPKLADRHRGLVLALSRLVLIDANLVPAGNPSNGAGKHPSIEHLERELRFLPTSAQLDAFEDAIARSPLLAADRALRAATTSWTTYFDTAEHLCLMSCDGPVARRLRVREYQGLSAPDPAAPCYLELKQTIGTHRSKARLAAPFASLARLIEGADDVDTLGADPDAHAVARQAIRDLLANGHFAPCVGTSYRRRCLATGPDLRITLDEDLTFFHPTRFGAPHDSGDTLAIGPALVLEVKYAGPLPAWVGRACAGLSEAPEFSKFRLGMMAVQRAALIAAGPTSESFPAHSPAADVGAAPRAARAAIAM
jgi:hypothetical protein